jgi:hypothetical protein
MIKVVSGNLPNNILINLIIHNLINPIIQYKTLIIHNINAIKYQ